MSFQVSNGVGRPARSSEAVVRLITTSAMNNRNQSCRAVVPLRVVKSSRGSASVSSNYGLLARMMSAPMSQLFSVGRQGHTLGEAGTAVLGCASGQS